MSAENQLDLYLFIMILCGCIALFSIVMAVHKDRKGKRELEQWQGRHRADMEAEAHLGIEDSTIARHFKYTAREWTQMDNAERMRLRDRFYNYMEL